MRLALTIALATLAALPAAGAFAADAGAPDAGAPICTTTTVVVKRGDVVLSTASTTHCEKATAHSAAAHADAVIKASETVLKTPDALLGSLTFGSGEALSLKNAPADWRVIDVRSGDVCHLVLNARPGASGLPARSEGCRGALARAATWRFQDGSVDVLAADGSRIVKLDGDRRQLSGQAADGDRLELQR